MAQIVGEKKEDILRLCKKYRVKTLEVFGSSATDDFNPETSDIDFLVDFLPGEDLGPWMSHYFEFKEELEGLLGYEVDLLMSNSPAMDNPYFLREVNSSRRLLYAA